MAYPDRLSGVPLTPRRRGAAIGGETHRTRVPAQNVHLPRARIRPRRGVKSKGLRGQKIKARQEKNQDRKGVGQAEKRLNDYFVAGRVRPPILLQQITKIPMDFSLHNDLLSIKINSVGAELKSLVKRETGQEYIWSGDPEVWPSTAPVLFPIIGKLKDEQTLIDGRPYRIPKHGIVRHNDRLELLSKLEDRIVLRLCSSEETYKLYPYHFDFRITFRLRNEHLIVYHEVRNNDEKPLLFHLGGHPAFRVPFFAGDRYDDYFLRFEHAEDSQSYRVTEQGTIGDDTRPVPWSEDGKRLPLTHELFAHDALVFKDLDSRSVNLESRSHGPVLKLDYAGWTHLGIWAKTNGDFVCIEPWIGLADSASGDGVFAHKEGIISLEPNEVYEMSYDIKIL